MPELVTIAEIAKRLRVDLTTVRRLIAKEGDSLQLALHRGKQDRLFLSREDAEKLIASYEARRGPVAAGAEVSDSATYDRYGYFYVIQLVPEALPNRVKIGFADNVEKRLAEHRTAAPTAQLLMNLPWFRRHVRSHESAVGVCHGQTEAAGVHAGVQGTSRAHRPRERKADRDGGAGTGSHGDGAAELGAAGRDRRRPGTSGALTTEEREELGRLRREKRTLRMERDILKNFRARRGPSHLLDEKLRARLR